MENIYTRLDKIRERPGLYIGDKRITSLFLYWCWYSGCLTAKGIEEPESIHFQEFHKWVAQYYNYSEATAGWKNMIIWHSVHEEDALNNFFLLLDKFRAGLSPEQARKEEND